MKVYFTYGSWEKFPHKNTYIIVEAENFNAAIAEYRKKYPDVNENCLNCSDYYKEEEWKNGVSKYYEGQEPAEILRTDTLKKFVLAFKDNHKEMNEAEKNDDMETYHECKGFETAMMYVLGEYGISYLEALKK